MNEKKAEKSNQHNLEGLFESTEDKNAAVHLEAVPAVTNCH